MEQFNPSSPADRAAASSAPPRDVLSAGATAQGRYLWIMVRLLTSATIFKGYDLTIFHLCTPDIAAPST